jgi:hypothetical protein
LISAGVAPRAEGSKTAAQDRQGFPGLAGGQSPEADPQVMIQKLEYVHHNPVKRGSVDDPGHWRYSSARNYAGMTGLVEVVTNWCCVTGVSRTGVPKAGIGEEGCVPTCVFCVAPFFVLTLVPFLGAPFVSECPSVPGCLLKDLVCFSPKRLYCTAIGGTIQIKGEFCEEGRKTNNDKTKKRNELPTQ